MDSSLVKRNVIIRGHRTSLCLEMEMWEALDDICRREGLSLNLLCTMIDTAQHDTSRTSTIRCFTLRYFRCIDAPGGRAVNALQMAMGLGRIRSTGLGQGFLPPAGPMPAARATAGAD